MVDNNLTPEEILEIEDMARVARRNLDLGMGPVGEKIFTVLRENNIRLLYFYIEELDSNSLEAFYLAKFSTMTKKNSYYIALNTKVSLDLQIFNLCHEYYHHIDNIENNLHVMRFGDPDDAWLNTKANRFAAEFLLPTESLTIHVRKNNRGEIDLSQWKTFTLLRFIAQIQTNYQVPYRMIIKRLREIEAIDDNMKEQLLSIDERSEESIYYVIASTLGGEEFIELNTSSCKKGVDNDALNIILQNYDEGAISLDLTVRDLNIFDKSLEEFGYSMDILEESIDEIFDLLEGE